MMNLKKDYNVGIKKQQHYFLEQCLRQFLTKKNYDTENKYDTIFFFETEILKLVLMLHYGRLIIRE